MKKNMLLWLLMVALLTLGALLVTRDAQHAAAQELETWTAVAPLPVPMGGGMVRCPDDPDGFYIVSGLMRKNVNSKFLFHYDINTDTWERLKGMPNALRGGASACYEGKIYVAGGTDLKAIFNTLYIYDIATNSWSSGPTLPNPVVMAGMGVWEGKLYLVGGTHDFLEPSERVDVYDIENGGWTANGAAPMLTAATSFARAQVGQYFYVVGGVGTDVNLTTTQRYDFINDEWEDGPTFTSQRAYSGLAASSTHLYALGGDIEDGAWEFHATDLVEVLDLSTWPDGAWEDLGIPLPVPNLYPPTTCTETLAGGEIWEVGGGLSANDTYTEVYYLPIGENCP
jgi:hypothetical protein